MKEEIVIYGFVIGDCLGLPFEFKTNVNCKGFIGNGTHNQELGTWSDDTALMLSLMDSSSIETHKKNLLRIKDYFCDEVVFDLGSATTQAILSDFKKLSKEEKGNGALLRCWTLAFEDISDNEIKEYLTLTHDSLDNIVYSMFYIDFLKLLTKGECEDKYDHLHRLYDKYRLVINTSNRSNLGDIKNTVESAITAFLKTSSFKEAIFYAVNNGNDTDSVAALTGALSAAYYGKINFKNKVRNRSKIDNIIKTWKTKRKLV